MKNDSIKKYLIPNIPYLFVLWAFLKLGTAYRLAAGADFAHKLMGLGQTIGPAFADFAPGLAPFDWLVGIVGAVAFRVMVYVKSKNAKKFRRDEEYGSARWGCPKDIAPFVDPKFENNIILTGTEFLTMNTRPKNPANARNLNACVIGSSGSGKTRFWLTPQILQASADKNGGCSYVCVDPKGGVLGQAGHFLQKRGYRIKVFNSIDFTKSMHYNPLAYIRNEADILKFVDALISNTKGEGKEGDPFWTKSETLLYRNVFSVVPKSKVKIVAKMLKAIHAQESKKASREKAKTVVAELRAMKLKEAAKKVEDGIEETLTYCDFPSEHWTRIRTNNVIERLNREIRRRTRVVGTFPDGNSALMLVCARLRHVAGTQWGSKKYMNMKHLEAVMDDASIAG